MTNATMAKFGYPGTLVGETTFWTVLLRPAQPTLGALVLVCKEPVQAFGDVSAEACADLAQATRRIEHVLADFVSYERINYLMLMMVDPDVHFHVIPRYSGSRDVSNATFPDTGWPGPPNLGQAVTLDDEQTRALLARLRPLWDAA